jgi:hypothetical protein
MRVLITKYRVPIATDYRVTGSMCDFKLLQEIIL